MNPLAWWQWAASQAGFDDRPDQPHPADEWQESPWDRDPDEERDRMYHTSFDVQQDW